MGYKYKKVNTKKIYLNPPHLKSQKIRFLRKYLQFLENKAAFIYLDKTGLYQNRAPVRRWVFEVNRRGMPMKDVRAHIVDVK